MQRVWRKAVGPSDSSARSDSGEVYYCGLARRIVFIPSILNLDLTSLAAVAALQLGAPEVMARGWSYYKFSEFGSCAVGVWERVADGYSPAVVAGGLVALVTHDGWAP